MKKTLPILTLVGLGIVSSVAAQTPAVTPPKPVASSTNAATSSTPRPSNAVAAPTHPAQTLVRRAADALEKYSAVTAKLRLAGEVFDQRVQGFGTYLQGPTDKMQVRCELKLAVGRSTVTLQQVADGQYLWSRRAIGDSSTLTRADLQAVQGRAGQGGMPIVGLPAPQRLLGFGGLPKLVRGLERAFDFNSVQQTQLAGVPGFTLRGAWSRAAIGQLLPDQKADIDGGAPPKLNRLAPQVPDQILVFLGRDDLFPYRIEYRRSDTSWESMLPGATSTPASLMTLDFFDVRLNGPLDAAQFVYSPGKEPVTDDTAAYASNRQWAAPAP